MLDCLADKVLIFMRFRELSGHALFELLQPVERDGELLSRLPCFVRF